MRLDTTAIRNRTRFFAGTDRELSAATSAELISLCDRVEAFGRLLDGLRLTGVVITERADIENAWAITNERAAKAESEVDRLKAAIETHRGCSIVCAACGHEPPCADDDVCASLEGT